MGHFETLRRVAGLEDGVKPPWPILFLFLVKCPPVARSLGLEMGKGVALLRR
jgi:uncharacterized protein with ATP-grasp and redox domains